MKSLLSTLLFLAIGTHAIAQTPSSCQGPDSIELQYLFDAKVLAVRQMQGDPNQQGEIKIPPTLVELNHQPLIAVYQAYGLPARDTVVKCLNIHTFPTYDLFSVVAGVDTTQPWVQKFIANTFPTGNNDADLLISNHQLTSSGFSPQLGILLVNSPVEVNTPGLAAKFAGLSGVVYAEPNYFAGDGNDIEVNTAPLSFWQASYTHGWGDCQAGCIQNRTWVFTINSMTCHVDFSNSFGDLVDFPCETVISGASQGDFLETFEASPSLTKGPLRVKMSASREAAGSLRLLSPEGKIALQAPVQLQAGLEQVMDLNMEHLPAGLYFLSLALDNQVFSKKILRIGF